jgi:hypothetical protein
VTTDTASEAPATNGIEDHEGEVLEEETPKTVDEVLEAEEVHSPSMSE